MERREKMGEKKRFEENNNKQYFCNYTNVWGAHFCDEAENRGVSLKLGRQTTHVFFPQN